MDALDLARWQFGIVTVYHFMFVPLTIGLAPLVAIMQTIWVRTGDERWLRLTKFFGKLFLINFAIGVATGIVQEFQFGMNWSEYSRFVGDIFGAPLAMEALIAFFVESTFLGLWVFGWDKLPKGVHAATIWIVAFGSNLSAFWILAANSFMQQPVGYVLRNGRAEMTDFFALISNEHVLLQFPHVLLSGVATAGFFVLGISAYHLFKRDGDRELFGPAFRIAAIYALIGSILVIPVGHLQGQELVRTQPMKMAAAEALYDTSSGAPFSVLSIGPLDGSSATRIIEVPGLLSFLGTGSFDGTVEGINDLKVSEKAMAAKVGVGGAVRVFAFANASGKSSTDILAMFQGGKGWGEIAHALGLHPGIGSIMSGGHGKGQGHGVGPDKTKGPDRSGS